MIQATENPLIGPLLPGVDPADKFLCKQFVAPATNVAHYGEFQSTHRDRIIWINLIEIAAHTYAYANINI